MPLTTTEINHLCLRAKSVYREYGLLTIIKKISYILSDFYYDFKFNIETTERLGKDNRADPHPDSLAYVGARYVQVIRAFNEVPVDYSESTLLEIGSGKGRAMAIAATHGFKKIIGIDYERSLVTLAKNNLRQMCFKKTKSIGIQHYDATLYKIPDEVNVIYFFNPFVGDTLKKVVENIHFSYKASPRKIFIIYLNEVDFDLIVKNQSWISKIKTLPTVDTVSGSLYVTHVD